MGISDFFNELEMPDFRGVWRVINKGEPYGFQIIWKDDKNQYNSMYMDPEGDITNTTEIYLKNKKLNLKTVYEKTNWEVTEVLEMTGKDTISVEGINNNGPFKQTLIKLLGDSKVER